MAHVNSNAFNIKIKKVFFFLTMQLITKVWFKLKLYIQFNLVGYHFNYLNDNLLAVIQ